MQEEVYAKGDPPYWKDDEVGICIVFPSWDRIEGRDENAWYVNFVSYQLGPERRYSWQGTTAKDMLDAMEKGIEELHAYHAKGGEGEMSEAPKGPITPPEVALMLREAYDLAARVAEDAISIKDAARAIRALGERVSVTRVGEHEYHLVRPMFRVSEDGK